MKEVKEKYITGVGIKIEYFHEPDWGGVKHLLGLPGFSVFSWVKRICRELLDVMRVSVYPYHGVKLGRRDPQRSPELGSFFFFVKR